MYYNKNAHHILSFVRSNSCCVFQLRLNQTNGELAKKDKLVMLCQVTVCNIHLVSCMCYCYHSWLILTNRHNNIVYVYIYKLYYCLGMDNGHAWI